VLLVSALLVCAVLLLWEALSPERVAFERIQMGMTAEEVGEVMKDAAEWDSTGTDGYSYDGKSYRTGMMWASAHGKITVILDQQGRVAQKSFQQGDQALKERVRRFLGRILK
jgi:hypothetical protein